MEKLILTALQGAVIMLVFGAVKYLYDRVTVRKSTPPNKGKSGSKRET